jgi:hypothetical protein
MQGRTELDPKALIYEAYRIEGITASQCRSIFLDWALSLPAGHDSKEAIRTLLDMYGADVPEHPMSVVLNQGLEASDKPKRRGGWRSRPR